MKKREIRYFFSSLAVKIYIIFSLVTNDSFLYTLLNFSRFSVISIYHFYEQKKKNYLVLENSFYLKSFY